jgi:hypothetical protein
MVELTIRIKVYASDEVKEVTTWLEGKKLPYEYTYDSAASPITIQSEVETDLVNKGIVWDSVEIIEE